MSSRGAAFPLPPDEAERLRALSSYGLLDTPPEPDFDRLADLAARLFNMPIALVSLIGRDRQFFKAKIGLDICETAREHSFCAHAVAADSVLVVLDASKDSRFSANPFVVGPPFIRFYAGAPLASASGHSIGTVCVIDTEPRTTFSDNERKNLQDIAALVMQQMEVRRLGRAQKLSEARFAESERHFRLLVNGVIDYAIYMLDPNGVVTNWNLGAQRIKGYRPEDIIGQHFQQFYTGEDREAGLPAKALAAAATEGRFEDEGWRVRKDGSRFWANVVIDAIRDEKGNPIGFAKITRDVTERRRNEEALDRLAHFDSLTGLPNRIVLSTRLEKSIERDEPIAVFLVDLDGFKDVNDTLGHTAGDAILRATADRLGAGLGREDIVARLDGDEFGILVPGLQEPQSAEAMGRELAQRFATPFTWEDQELHIGASVGIAIGAGDRTSAGDLLANADLALYRAKADGRHGFRLFEPAFRERAVARRACERELRRAVAQGELELFYQPQVAMADRSIVGAEALLRWRHPERGLLSPAAFLPVLETSRLAASVGDWTIRTACAHIATAHRNGAACFRVGVNLFGAQFQTGALVSIVEAALAENKLPASALELEITENIILHHDEAVVASLRELRALGVGIAFDDYGTGYASLSHLKRIPLTRLKIDRSFVRDICVDKEDAAVVQAILYLGKSYGLDIIAEGIETEAQEGVLRRFGCGEGQGYLYGRPAPAEQFLSGLKDASSELPSKGCVHT